MRFDAFTNGRRASTLQRRASRSTERGAILVETALIGLFLSMIVFAAADFGMLFRQANETSDAIRSAARVGTATGNDQFADYDILQAMKNSNTGLAGGVNKVMIFKANPTTGQPQGNCANFVATAGLCNVYTAADADSSSAVLNKDNYWSPDTRNPGADYLGVRVQADYKYMTKFFGNTKVFGDLASVRLEAATSASNPSSPRVDNLDNGSDRVPPIGETKPNEDVGGGGGSSGSGGSL